MLYISPPNYTYCPFCSSALDSRLEEGKSRSYCPQCGWVYYPYVASTAGAVIIKGNKVLMVKRNREPYKGTWMFPAGFIDYGEHPEDTVKREVKEETGLEIDQLTFIDVFQVPDDPRAPGHYIFFYKVSVKDGKLENDDEENEAIDWFPIDNLPEIGWLTHKHVATLIAKSLRQS